MCILEGRGSTRAQREIGAFMVCSGPEHLSLGIGDTEAELLCIITELLVVWQR